MNEIPQEWAEYLQEMEQYYAALSPEELAKLAKQLGMTLEEILPSPKPAEPAEQALRIVNTAPELEVPGLFD